MYSITSSPIPTFVINLSHRVDRLESINKELYNRKEFNVQIFPAISSPENGAKGLWLTFKEIIKIANDRKYPFVLICEDDHVFTENYSTEKLQDHIEIAYNTKTDILLGGVSWFDFSVKICEGLHWVNTFNGTQFLIIFDWFYDSILSQDTFLENNTLDIVISSLSDNKLVSFPFVSVQKDTGYSDVTINNNVSGFVGTLFSGSSDRFHALEDVYRYVEGSNLTTNSVDYDEYQLSAYVINTIHREDRLKSVQEQFADKPEFDLKILTSPKEKNGAIGLWNNIKRCVTLAIENDEDVILICEDDHVFSAEYSKKVLFDSIFQGASLGAELILGGISNYHQGIVASPNLIWVAAFQCTQFTIVFKNIFQRILAIDFAEDDAADLKLSFITSNKFVIHPFISYQKDFGYSDIPINGVYTEDYLKWFKRSEYNLDLIRRIPRLKERQGIDHLSMKD